MDIFDKYIKDDGSPPEVNIDSNNKSCVVQRTYMEAFQRLPLDDAALILDGAAKELGSAEVLTFLHGKADEDFAEPRPQSA
ncbi:unnamed protein product, partial [Ectocarpus sp. 12 AP-2014]